MKTYPTGVEALRVRRPRDRGRRVLRPARPERRRQVDPDPLHDRARAADRRRDPRLRPRRGHRLRARAPGGRAGAAGAQPRLVPDPRGDARLPRRLLRDAEEGAPRARRRAARDLLALRQAQGAHPLTLSGGMKRRLILARALMHRPRLLILDEPTAGVDIELRLELWHYVQRINEEGTTILLTTHYLEEAEQLCDRIAFINEGNIVAQRLRRRSSPRATASTTLEDAYLELVGRKELSRSRVAAELSSSEPTLRCDEHGADPLLHPLAARAQPLHEDQEADDRRAAARDLPLHLGLRRRARLADQHAARVRLRGLRRSPG